MADGTLVASPWLYRADADVLAAGFYAGDLIPEAVFTFQENQHAPCFPDPADPPLQAVCSEVELNEDGEDPVYCEGDWTWYDMIDVCERTFEGPCGAVDGSLPSGETGDLIYLDHPADDAQDGSYIRGATDWRRCND